MQQAYEEKYTERYNKLIEIAGAFEEGDDYDE